MLSVLNDENEKKPIFKSLENLKFEIIQDDMKVVS